MSFEWDEKKRNRNIEIHGVDFQLAAAIFLHPVIETVDNRNHYGETRIEALGVINDEYFTIIYTWRNQSRRIISAWKAGRNGKRRYKALFNGRD
ncbi:MAG: BrnT family toxin [Bacteroidota bacterium]